ncbi:2-C-methyl-D-erythritol 4-phosphate cytidylyltransferase [soil metagenome]
MAQFFRLQAYFRDIASDFSGLSFVPFREDLFSVIPTEIQTTAIERETDHESPTSPQYIALIPAAGVGARMGGTTPKQYLQIAQQPILRHTVRAFLAAPQIAHTYVVVSADDGYADAALAGLAGVTVLRCGGATRSDTVSNGLAALAALLAPQDWVLVHDAARPGLTAALLSKLMQQVGQHAVGGLLALPVVDTVKRVVNGRVETISREGVWLAQTPQMFRYGLLSAALSASLTAASQVTDESSAVEAAGMVPLLVEGHACNLKVTLPADLALAQRYLAGQME